MPQEPSFLREPQHLQTHRKSAICDSLNLILLLLYKTAQTAKIDGDNFC